MLHLRDGAPWRCAKTQVNSLFNVLKNSILYRIISHLCAVVCIVSCASEAPEVPARSAVFTETYRAGLDLLERHRLLAAERAFKRCVALVPEAYEGHWQLGRLRLLQGRIDEGIEGLVHVSEMSWSTHLRSAQDFVNVGDNIEAIVLNLDRESRKMSLGMKQLSEDPWTDITNKFPIGSKHKGSVRNFTNFGVFIELEEGIDGLIYISDLSWTKKIKHPSEFLAIEDKIDVVILDLDVDGRKLSLGHKQTKDNPWDLYEKDFAVDTIHKSEVSEIVDKGAIIGFNDDISAFCPLRHMDKADGSKLEKGEIAEFKVIEFSKEFKRVVVSHLVTHGNDPSPDDSDSEKKKNKKSKKKDDE